MYSIMSYMFIHAQADLQTPIQPVLYINYIVHNFNSQNETMMIKNPLGAVMDNRIDIRNFLEGQTKNYHA